MKNPKVIIILTIFLIAASSASLLAQGREARTRSAQAAYGYPTGEYKSKKKKKKKQKKVKATKRKGNAPLYRKKNPWVN